jgi:collagen triple helix repeat protein
MKKCYFLLIPCTLVIVIALMLTACSKRATGPAGPQGSAGLQGTPGAQGAPGPAGSQIFEGDSVPADTLGNVGDFYINEQTDSLYGPKTLSGWGNAISLQGTAGTQGAPGTPGAPGTQGTPGAPGATGATGAAGSQILSGPTTPTLTIGSTGDYYFDDLTDSLHGPKTSTSWGIAVSLRGASGAAGAAGQNGANGQTGAQGPPGTANVIYYNWTAFDKTIWSAFDNIAYDRTYSINIPVLTSQIVNQGVVLVYFEHLKLENKDTTGQQVYQVPTVFSYVLNGNSKANLTDEFKPGVLNFYLSQADGGTLDPGTLYTSINTAIPEHVLTESYLYRIILIPGGVLGTSVDPHTLTYKAVCAKYGLQP